jgi:hypothetical protein
MLVGLGSLWFLQVNPGWTGSHWVPVVIQFVSFFLFLARFLFQISFFSKSRLCTHPLFSHFVTNLDRLAGQPIQIFLQSRFRIQIFMYSSIGSILWEATV